VKSGKSDDKSVNRLFARLERSIKAGNPNTALAAVLELGNVKTERGQVPDDFLERIFKLLQSRDALESAATATVLQFVEFQLLNLTKAQRRRCMDMLKAISGKLVDGDARCIAGEIYDQLLIAKN
jgi:hypothetical protein